LKQFYKTGVARLFCSRAKFENYFSSGAFAKHKKYGLLDACCEDVLTVLFQFVLIEFYIYKGSKNSWRAACGPQATLWP